MTAALEGGEWSAARLGRTLPPGKNQYPFYRRLGVPKGRSGREENLFPTGIRSPDRSARSSVAIPTELPGPHNRNEYQGHFQRSKCDLCVRLTTLPPSGTVYLEILATPSSWSPKAYRDLYRDIFNSLKNINKICQYFTRTR